MAPRQRGNEIPWICGYILRLLHLCRWQNTALLLPKIFVTLISAFILPIFSIDAFQILNSIVHQHSYSYIIFITFEIVNVEPIKIKRKKKENFSLEEKFLPSFPLSSLPFKRSLENFYKRFQTPLEGVLNFFTLAVIWPTRKYSPSGKRGEQKRQSSPLINTALMKMAVDGQMSGIPIGRRTLLSSKDRGRGCSTKPKLFIRDRG